MKYIGKRSKLTSPVIGITVGVLVALLVQLIAAISVSLLVQKGMVEEGSVGFISHFIRGVGLGICVITICILESGNQYVAAAIGVVACFVVQFVTGLLFWRPDFRAFMIGAVTMVAVYLSCVFVLSRKKGRGTWKKLNRRYG